MSEPIDKSDVLQIYNLPDYYYICSYNEFNKKQKELSSNIFTREHFDKFVSLFDKKTKVDHMLLHKLQLSVNLQIDNITKEENDFYKISKNFSIKFNDNHMVVREYYEKSYYEYNLYINGTHDYCSFTTPVYSERLKCLTYRCIYKDQQYTDYIKNQSGLQIGYSAVINFSKLHNCFNKFLYYQFFAKYYDCFTKEEYEKFKENTKYLIGSYTIDNEFISNEYIDEYKETSNQTYQVILLPLNSNQQSITIILQCKYYIDDIYDADNEKSYLISFDKVYCLRKNNKLDIVIPTTDGDYPYWNNIPDAIQKYLKDHMEKINHIFEQQFNL